MILTCNRCGRRSETDAGMQCAVPGKDGGICGGIYHLPAEDNADYITRLATASIHRQIVAVMKYDKPGDAYTISKCSAALSIRAAESLADSWAAALRLEIR